MKTIAPFTASNVFTSNVFTAALLVLAAGSMSLSGPVFAQQAKPDAGSLLREELRRDQSAVAPGTNLGQAAKQSDAKEDTGLKVLVSGFRVVGLSAVPQADVSGYLANFSGKPTSVEGLNKVAEQFEQWLKARGLFTARAYVPPQDIAGGLVEIRVLEGRMEGIDVKAAQGTRLSEATLRAFLAGALPPGSALQQEQLERGLLLLNDLPATSARAVLTPGKELGGSRVVIEAAQGPVFSGSVDADNTGNRFTGNYRLGAALTVNDAYGWADQWSLRGSASEGSVFVRAAYSLPLASSGWRGGVSLIGTTYKLCCDAAISALDSNGTASAASVFVSYPIMRGRFDNLHASLSYAARGFVNKSLGQTTSDKTSNALTLGFSGDHSNVQGLTGLGTYYTYGLQFAGGALNLDNVASDKTQDAATAQTHGAFGKITAQATQTLRLSKDSTLYTALSVQGANKNLDSSDKFSLGGPQGVRAYPTGEASGDEGVLLNVEYRKEINRNLGMIAFLDGGRITLHKTLWANVTPPTGQGPDNSYALSGIGASLVYSPLKSVQVTTTLATRLGENPARDANGNDSDGRSGKWMLWLQGSVGF